MSDGLVLTFFVWVTAHVAASGIPEEMWLPEQMTVLHLPGEAMEARLVWTGDGPQLAASFLAAKYPSPFVDR